MRKGRLTDKGELMKEKARVALIFGGEGSEREVSLAGAKFVLPLIDREKYEVVPTLITQSGEWLVFRDGAPFPTDISRGIPAFPTRRGFTLSGEIIKIDCAIPLLHGTRGEDGIIQVLLASAGIAFVGSDAYAGSLAMDKAFTKTVVSSLGIPTVRGHLLIDGSATHTKEGAIAAAEADFGYPMFVKPAREGSSVGAATARDREELDLAIGSATAASDGRALIEEYIDNRVELECAYLGACGKQLFTGIGEITTEGFYDYGEKYAEGSKARVSPSSKYEDIWGDRIREWSQKIVEMLGVRQLARLDYFLSGDRLYFNELNTFPGFTEASLYPALVARCGIDPKELIELLIQDTLC